MMFDQINTREEADQLPPGSVVMEIDGGNFLGITIHPEVYYKDPDDGQWYGTLMQRWADSHVMEFPARVLWYGSW